MSGVLVLGLGVTGDAVVRHRVAAGDDVVVVEDVPAGDDAYRDRVAAAEAAGAVVVEQPAPGRLVELARATDVVVPSPGVPLGHPALVAARESGVRVRAEVDLAAELAAARGKILVAVTGTNGKTTVTTLITAMLDSSGGAALGAGWGLGLPIEALRFGAETFESSLGTAPGRFNVVTHRDSTVILDYGHNSSALLALTEAIRGMRHRRRKVVYTAAGDRRDEDIVRQAQILGNFFHEIYVYEDKCTRGRPDGEVIRLMREGFAQADASPRVVQLSGELRSIGAAIGSLEPGDLLLCQVDQVELALEFVTGLFRQAESRSLSSLAQLAAAALAALGMMG